MDGRIASSDEIVLFHTNMHDQFLYLLAELINNNCLA
jgi:hypothetical protein